MGAKPVHIGCSGWQYKHWDGAFYPDGMKKAEQLAFYAKHFDTVEVNTTFYGLPKPESVAKWVDQAPPGFSMAIKGSKFMTQRKKLIDFRHLWPRLYRSIDPLASSPHMGPVLWQLPGGWKRNHERLLEALSHLPPGRHAFEFRHESWFVPETYEALRAAGAALVIGDHPDRLWQEEELTADFTYIRFHYGHDLYNGNYSQDELEDWAQWLDGVRDEVEVFAYFNNDWNCYALQNAATLKELLGIQDGLIVPQITKPAPKPLSPWIE